MRLPGPKPLAARRILGLVLLVCSLATPPVTAAPGESEARTGEPAAGSAPLPAATFARRLSAEVYGYLPYWEIDALGAFATGGVTRLGGADRYATAAALPGESFPRGAPVAYLVSGLGFADALAAAPAAARDGGPLLLTTPDGLPDATRDELLRLAPARVVIVGGEASVTPAVGAAIAELLPGVKLVRHGGANRYATAALVAATFVSPDSVYVASGAGFADALAAAAAAGAAGGPILLTRPDALPVEIASAMAALAPARATVVGGEAAVSGPVIAQLRTVLAGS